MNTLEIIFVSWLLANLSAAYLTFIFSDKPKERERQTKLDEYTK